MASIQNCAPALRLLCPQLIVCCTFNRFNSHITRIAFLLLVSTSSLEVSSAAPVNSESPEVRKLIDSGLAFLEENTDERLGGKCVVALAFHKDGASPSHHRIREAVEACKAVNDARLTSQDIYSLGLAIILLAELDPNAYRSELIRYGDALQKLQKSGGGWGYANFGTGDTSQTQYAVLGYWELLQSGIAPTVESAESCLNWLLRTQDPKGGWGYQGNDPGNMTRVPQTKTTLSMASAGLGSTLILANVLSLSEIKAKPEAEVEEEKSTVPAALQLAQRGSRNKGIRLSGNGVDKQRLQETIRMGQEWFDTSFQSISGAHICYVLYSIERYKSFEELLSGNIEPEPDWYQRGYEYLNASQNENGSWAGQSGPPCSTAFAVLFLLRSTQKSIKEKFGEGTLVGGRGLQADLSRMKLERGRLIAQRQIAQVSDLLGMLDGSASEALEQLIANPNSLRTDQAGPENARQLQQIVKSGVPEARIISVRVLAQQRNLDHVPTLLFAMTDPDQRVVREARDGMRLISRRIGGYGLTDNFTDEQRYDVIDKWKRWYRRVRPNAPPIP